MLFRVRRALSATISKACTVSTAFGPRETLDERGVVPRHNEPGYRTFEILSVPVDILVSGPEETTIAVVKLVVFVPVAVLFNILLS